MQNRRRSSDRRSGTDRRRAKCVWEAPRIPTWEEQRAQHITRYVFCAMALLYFNIGEGPRADGWFSQNGINAIFICYSLFISVTLLAAQRRLHSPLRWRIAMWVDLTSISCAILADKMVLSPGFLVFLMVILGNGMRYGMRVFAEAVIGSFACALLVLCLRISEYVKSLSIGTAFSTVFFIIFVLYSYSLMSRLESRKRRLESERNRDELTGLLNRRALFERAAHFFDNRSSSQTAAVLFLDLDGFKEVNDTHGHHTGDRVLSEIGRIMSCTVRDSDLVARYGGDEFVMVLSNEDVDAGRVVAQRLQQKVQEWSSQNKIKLSLSIGIGQTPEHGNDLNTVIQHVDHAMYQGRNDIGRGGIRLAPLTAES